MNDEDKNEEDFGWHALKTQPYLRMVANGSTQVNSTRARFRGNVCVPSSADAIRPTETLDVTERAPTDLEERESLVGFSHDVDVSVFVHFTQPRDFSAQRNDIRARAGRDRVHRSRGKLATTTLALDEIRPLLDDTGVSFVEAGETLVPPTFVAESVDRKVRAPRKSDRQIRGSTGAKTLVGIIDVGGFDFAHEDFLCDTDGGPSTRFYRIWDQGGKDRPHPKFPFDRDGRFDRGSEITRKHMNKAIEMSPEIGLPAQRLEPQSQMVIGSHGTHVASIAAGNRGVCPEADIVGVIIDIPNESIAGRQSFYDSTQVAHAIDYILLVARELAIERGEPATRIPISINISLGTNGGAHDGTSALARWTDSVLNEPGVCITVAAGNAGQETPTHPDDGGYRLGRIHTSGRIEAKGLESHLEWEVVGDSIVDVSDNEMEIWYSAADRFTVSVKPPGGQWTKTVEPGESLQNLSLPNGALISIYNELYHPVNGDNYIAIYLSPFYKDDSLIVGIPPGTWEVKLTGADIRGGAYHAWIERDDPQFERRAGVVRHWHFPSWLGENTYVDQCSIGSLACARDVIAVGNLDEDGRRANITSSQGPTRDGRQKPEIAAPGTRIVAANGFYRLGGEADQKQVWAAKTGTSMASPYVAGVVALLLEKNPDLRASQIRGILQRTAKPVPGATYAWSDDIGFGQIAARDALKEATHAYRRRETT